MEGLQRSAVSFRRQGSSGLVWDDKFLTGLINQVNNEKNKEDDQSPDDTKDPPESQQPTPPEPADNSPEERNPPPPPPIETSAAALEKNRSGRVSPAIEPPSPRVSACGFCGAFRKPSEHSRKNAKRRTKPRSR